MTFDELLHDISKLIGLELQSIRPGSNIVILGINHDLKTIELRTEKGDIKKRPFSEIRKIWERMTVETAVHVERVLNGSGSSRNQPETILANLPYVEYLWVDGKKHIAYVGENTHPYGTLKQMDPISASKIIERIKETNICISAVIVTLDIAADVSFLNKISSGIIEPLSGGIYSFQTKQTKFLLVNANTVGLDVGCYPVIYVDGEFSRDAVLVFIGSQRYFLCSQGDFKILVLNSGYY